MENEKNYNVANSKKIRMQMEKEKRAQTRKLCKFAALRHDDLQLYCQ